jgi:hypothetical protein
MARHLRGAASAAVSLAVLAGASTAAAASPSGLRGGVAGTGGIAITVAPRLAIALPGVTQLLATQKAIARYRAGGIRAVHALAKPAPVIVKVATFAG